MTMSKKEPPYRVETSPGHWEVSDAWYAWFKRQLRIKDRRSGGWLGRLARKIFGKD